MPSPCSRSSKSPVVKLQLLSVPFGHAPLLGVWHYYIPRPVCRHPRACELLDEALAVGAQVVVAGLEILVARSLTVTTGGSRVAAAWVIRHPHGGAELLIRDVEAFGGSLEDVLWFVGVVPVALGFLRCGL